MLHKISTGKRQEGETALWAALNARSSCSGSRLRTSTLLAELVTKLVGPEDDQGAG